MQAPEPATTGCAAATSTTAAHGAFPDPWPAIADDVRLYPSPHNSQPIKLAPHDATTATVSYDLDLGLPAESYGIPFAHVCAGVFLESLRVVAAGLGFAVAEALDHADMDFDSPARLHRVATVTLAPQGLAGRELRNAEAALARFRTRRTSRRPYLNRRVPATVLQRAERIAADAGYEFRHTVEPGLVKKIVHVNQATLFDDLENEAVYNEIMTWLRFTDAEARTKADGLSAQAMLLPGHVFKFAMGHRGMWNAPGIGAAIKAIYLNTMRGVRSLGWLEGPFAGPADYIEAGRTFMKIWLLLHEHGVVLHPFGTVITNPRSHAQFAELVGAREDETRMAWMLFRFGYSRTPPVAYHRSGAAMLIAPKEDRP